MPERDEIKPKPILCRSLKLEVSRAIDVLIGARIYRSRDEALARLAEEGLHLKFQASPALREAISQATRLSDNLCSAGFNS